MSSENLNEVTSPEEISEVAISLPEVTQNAANDLSPDTTEPGSSIPIKPRLQSPLWGWIGGGLLGVIVGGGLVFALAMLGNVSSKESSKTTSAPLVSPVAGVPAIPPQGPAGRQINSDGGASRESTTDKNTQKATLSQAKPPATESQVPEHPTQTERDSLATVKQSDAKKPPSEAEQTFAKVAAAMDRGDLDGAEKAGIEKLPVTKPEELALRGKYRFRRYLQKQTLSGGKIDSRDPAMTAAIADLVKANTADASLELVEVYLCIRELDLAEKTAKEGQAKFNDHRFKTALIRVRLEQTEPKKTSVPVGAPRSISVNSASALALVATVAIDNSTESDFLTDELLLQALKDARDQRFTEAKLNLKAAIELAKRLSGSSKQIFSPNPLLHAMLIEKLGNHLTAAWEEHVSLAEAHASLVKQRYLPIGRTTSEDLPEAVNRALADATAFKKVGAKLTEAKFIGKPEEVINRVDEMIAALQDIRTHLVEQKVANGTELDKTVTGVHDAVRIAHMKDPNWVILGLENQVKAGRRAAELMPVYLRTLQDRYTGLERLAREDAARVNLDESATPANKAHATLVQALADRNEGKYAEAKLLLGECLPCVEKESVYATVGATLLLEVNDPGAYILSRVVELQSRGQSDEALRLLQTSLDSIQPEVRSILLARRALLYLDHLLRKAKGSISSNDPLLEKVKEDADAAGECSEAKYVLGRIAEGLGNQGDAAQLYRRAIDLSARTTNRENAVVYRAALLRVLAVPKPLPPTSARSTPSPDRGGIGQMNATDLRAALAVSALALQPGIPECVQPTTNAAPVSGTQNGSNEVEFPWLASSPRDRLGPIGTAYAKAQAEHARDTPVNTEIIQHADAILAQGDSAPFNARSVALAVKGGWTEGLFAYAEGLHTQLPGELSESLRFLIRNHPLLKHADTRRPDPVTAEVLYRQGVGLYYQRDYPDAERLLKRSIEASDQNALVHYFLGLTLLAQGKTGKAYESFESGAHLERIGKTGAGAVDQALERVQGNQRTILEWFRNRVEPLSR